jgi:hypothetical protein
MNMVTMTPAMIAEMMKEHLELNPDRPVRPDIKEALDEYAYHGRPLGQFLTYVVENNLMQALGHADSYNRATIFQICSYIYNDLPAGCHGSPERVERHLKSFKTKREEDDRET